MSVKKIITNETLLSKKSVDVDFGAAQNIIDDLVDTAEEYRNSKMGCAGLAANQLGYYVRIFVIMLDGWYEPIVNPKVIKKGGRMIKAKESCLSRPGQPSIEKIRRQRITIEFLDIDNRIVRRTFHNFEARVVQHEMDHFKGMLI